MSTATSVDSYLEAAPEPQRSTLEKLRLTIRSVVPDAEECISYNMPAYRIDGKVVAGFAAFKKHCAYLPHSGSVFEAMADELVGYEYTQGSLHFAIDKPLPKALVRKLISVRRAQAGV